MCKMQCVNGSASQTSLTDQLDRPDGRTSWTNQMDGPDGRTSWKDQLDRPAKQTSWTNQLDRPAGRTNFTDQLDGPVLFIWSLGQFAYSKIFLSVCTLSQLPSPTKALFSKYKLPDGLAPGKHFPGPDFPLLKMGKVNPFDSFYILWGQHFPSYILNKKGKVDL